jgi:segregation and condensation protein B
MDPNQLKAIIEAALLGAAHPLSLPQIAALFAVDEQPGHADLVRAIDALREDCAGRGVELTEVASGYRYQVRQEVHPWVARLWTERQTRYSRALLETLALIAYRQPITRGEIEQIRGVAVSTSIVRTLEEREWVRVVGYRDLPGRPALFGTTKAFLDYFNLSSLDQLPSLGEIRELEDPQLEFDRLPDESLVVHAADSDGNPDPGDDADDPAAPPDPTATNTEPSAADAPAAGATEFNA